MSGSSEPTKTCPDCRVDKPINAFSRNALRPDGLQFYCKLCFSVRSARNRRERRIRQGLNVRAQVDAPPGTKYCPSCREIVPYAGWDKARRTRDGLASHCKACRKERARRDHLRRTFGLTTDDLAG